MKENKNKKFKIDKLFVYASLKLILLIFPISIKIE